MGRKYHDVRVLIHRAFAVFLTVFLISYVGRVYASRNLEIIAQQRETQADAIAEFEALKLMEEGLRLKKQGSKESLLIGRKKYEAALVLWKKLGDKKLQATTLLSIGRIYSDLGENRKVLQYYHQALPLIREVGYKFGEAIILNNIAFAYDFLGEKRKALQYYDLALPLRRDRGGKAGTLNNIAKVYSDLGEKQKALQYYNQALLLKRAVEDRDGEATALNNIGQVYDTLGEKQKALQFYNQALPISRAVGDKRGEAITLNNIGLVYNSLKENQKALQYFNQALPLQLAAGDRNGEATTLHNISAVYLDLGENQNALQKYNQVLPLFRAMGDRYREAVTLNSIGQVYTYLRKKQKALQFYNEALLLRRAVEDRSGEATTLNDIGKVYWVSGEKQKALQYYNQALSLKRAVKDRGGEAIVLQDLALLEREQGNLQASLNHIKNAIAIIEELRGTYTNQDLKTTYFSTVQSYYKFYIDLLMDLHKKDPLKGYDALALHISERSRARGLIELLAQANAKISKNVDPKLIAQEQELRLKRQAQEKILAKLVNQLKPPQDTIKRTETEIQNIINQQKALKAKIRAQNPERDKITNPEPLKLPQIQQQLDKNSVLLQYSLGKERSYLWLVTPTSLTSYELPKRKEIEEIANKFHEDLKVSTKDESAIKSAQKLSKIILAPVADKLTGKRLVIVADDVLQQIPFAALTDVNNANYQPLILKHEIVNLPSASTIVIQREKLTNRQPAAKKIAILADPVYSHEDERVTGKPPTITPPLDFELSALKRSAKSLNRQGWGRLKNTAIEAKEILKLVPSSSSLKAFDFDANYNWAANKKLNQFQILHFATHGFVNPDQPELSGIVLSLVNKDAKHIPGYLRLADLFEQDYPAELIVLSACETGLGKNVSGEGLVGLTRGLMYAGAARVALSLWKVNDEGTSVLMQEFYKQMLQENQTPTQALRAAQRKLLSNPKWRNLHYWSAFTLQGEWK